MLDKETQQILNEDRQVADFVKSSAWQTIKQRLIHKLEEMNAITAIDFKNKTAEQIAIEAEARANSVRTIFDWIQDVEGTVNKNEMSTTAFQQIKEEIIINI